MAYPQNPDRVTPPVTIGAGMGLVVAALVKTYFDVEIDPADGTQLWEWSTAVLFPALPAIGAWVGARFKARNDVTPVKPGDTPRDQAGNALVPISPPPTTAARRPPFETP